MNSSTNDFEQKGAEIAKRVFSGQPVSPEERLLNAMFVAWAIRSRLVSRRFRVANEELVSRTRLGENPSEELAELFARSDYLGKRGNRFADFYFSSDLPARDLELLGVVQLSDNSRSYDRVATLMDGHLARWSEE